VIRAVLASARVRRRRDDPGRFAAARRAEAMIRDALAEDLSIRSIAVALGIPLRSLEQGFRDLYGLSAREYLYTLRLDAARRDLLRARNGETVGAVACRWNLHHLGRFSTNYGHWFGETPRETLRSRGGRRARR
jgi:AraC-like DNA-binding protein